MNYDKLSFSYEIFFLDLVINMYLAQLNITIRIGITEDTAVVEISNHIEKAEKSYELK